MTNELNLSVEESARRLGIGRTMFLQEARSGRIRTLKIGRRRLGPVQELEDYVARGIDQNRAS